jgi:hypothetical protein
VSQNAIRAAGQTGEALGGGIWNGTAPESEDLTPRLSVFGTAITGNEIVAGSALEVHGGGLFTSEPVPMERVRIRGNRPDECSDADGLRGLSSASVSVGFLGFSR